MLDTLIATYYLKHHYFHDDRVDREEWRIHRIGYAESFYINYNNATTAIVYTWMWNEWYGAEKPDRQKWFSKMRHDCITHSVPDSLASLPTATCTEWTDQYYFHPLCTSEPKQGINPMKMMTSSTDLTINTVAQPSDASKARDFLMSEYQDMTRYTWQDERYPAMRKLYNIDAPTVPETSQGIIDAFKNGKVVIDQAKIDKQTAYFAALALDNDSEESFYEPGISSKYFGITFTDLPVADRKGYADAVEAYEKLKTDTRRKLAILDPEAGLEILTAFEAWKPTLATATAH